MRIVRAAVITAVAIAAGSLTSALAVTQPSEAATVLQAPQRLELPEAFRPSPDGRFIAFDDEGHLAVRPATGGEARRVVTHTADGWVRSFTWSRDSARLAYAWCTHAKGVTIAAGVRVLCDLRTVEVIGGALQVLLAAVDHAQPALLLRFGAPPPMNVLDWSPDGRFVLALFRERPVPGANQLVVINTRDGSFRSVMEGDLGEMSGFMAPPFNRGEGAMFSPDGRFVVYGGPDIRALSLETAETRVLVPRVDGVFYAPFGWSPDGENLVFSQRRCQSADVWAVAVKDGRTIGDPKMLARGLGFVSAGVTTSTGTMYFRRAVAETRGVWAVSLDPSSGTIASTPALQSDERSGFNLRPMWSPDGRYLAYQARESICDPKASIGIMSTDSRDARFVLFTVQGDLGLWDFDWAPDGQSFLVNVAQGIGGNTGGAYRIDARTGDAREVVPSTAVGRFRRWLPGGRSTVYLTLTSGIAVRNLDTGTDRIVFNLTASGGLQSLALAPDGQRVAIAVPDRETGRSTLTVVELTDGAAHTAADLPRWRRLSQAADRALDLAPVRHTWSADGRHVMYLRHREDQPNILELWRVSAAGGGTPERLGVLTTNPNEHIHRLTARSDGRSLAFELIRTEPGGDYVMERVFMPAGLESRP